MDVFENKVKNLEDKVTKMNANDEQKIKVFFISKVTKRSAFQTQRPRRKWQGTKRGARWSDQIKGAQGTRIADNQGVGKWKGE